MYDYGARWYDAAIGRWTAFDKLAEDPNQIDKSPYAYTWNNPVNLNDPDGNCPNCLTALVGAAVQGGIELGGQLLSGKSLREVDWADVGVEAAKGALKGSGAGILLSTTVEIGGSLAKATIDVSVDQGVESVYNGKKSIGAAVVDGATDLAGGKVGKGVSNVSTKAVNQTVKSADKTASSLTKATNNYNKVTNGGRNLSGTNSTTAKQNLTDAKMNNQAAHAQKKVTGAANYVLNSTVGKLGGEVAENKSNDALKRVLNVNN